MQIFNKSGLIILIGLIVTGCTTNSRPAIPLPVFQNIAVVTFHGPFTTPTDLTEHQTCQAIDPVINSRIENNLTKHTGAAVETVNLSLPKNISDGTIHPIQLIRDLPAGTFDSVFICIINSCTSRKGSAYSVSVPAEIGLKAYLFSLPSKKLLWQNDFYESQKSLSENLFTAGKFIKRKGKWITVRALAIEGVDSLMATLPTAPSSTKDK